MTERRNSPSPRSDPRAPRPAGPEFAAYATLPAPTHIARRLRDIQALAHEFELHLGRALDCNPTDLAAMEHLLTAGPMSPGDLSRRLGVTSAAGSLVTDRLVALGHVTRHPHEVDRRRTIVHPSPASVERAVSELTPVAQGVDAIVSSLNEHDREVVERFLDAVADVYAAAVQPDRSERDLQIGPAQPS